ncbi:PREDICTED: piggyBac transposable element-derived protein 4-like [Habropoda laboriosa]|uniref:piggyBac transposable element-derived protein 4-like n=1 Tax=Habropoda laboriosa TaxID=597456 RepID=UPI00083D2A6A|nr:PREDICTED: piggyBac transposable element-derived protein 4-like [Habropoda laboriosa]
MPDIWSETDSESWTDDEVQICDNESDSGSDIIIPKKRLRAISESSDDELSGDCTEHASVDEFLHLDSWYSNEKFYFTEVPGPQHPPDPEAKPIEYFSIFFSFSLLSTMVTETNRYAHQFLSSNNTLKRHSRAKKWKPVTIVEMKAFITVLLEMGITRRPTMMSYWNTGSRQIPWFGKMFPRDRFLLIIKFFHLVDNTTLAPPGHPDYDPCGKFCFLVDYANKIFREQYTPHQQLSIDESLVGTHCQSSIKQYLPNKKHHKWGIKFWVLCDSVSKYCLGFLCYRGAKSTESKEEIKKNGLGYVVVQQLLNLGNYLNKGFHVFTDNFFTSIQLAKVLLQKNTYITGTIRKNRKNVPKEAKFADVGKSKYFESNGILMCSYREKKSQRNPVILVSTNCTTDNVVVTKKRGIYESEKTKPAVVHNYNKFMGGVDEADKMLYAYLDERRTMKYWKKVAFNIIGRMVLNAYIIYSENYKETTHINNLRHLHQAKYLVLKSYLDEICGDVWNAAVNMVEKLNVQT